MPVRERVGAALVPGDMARAGHGKALENSFCSRNRSSPHRADKIRGAKHLIAPWMKPFAPDR